MRPHTNPTINTPSISLILPAFNEAEVIALAIAEADIALREVADCYEIIVVDDGSTDETAAIVERLATENPQVRLVRHHPNRGYGAAIRSGLAAAQGDLIAFTDADCQFDLTELDRFVLLSQRYEIVCGYRIDRKDSQLRCFYSRVYNLLVRALLGTEVRDVDCALKMFRRDVAKRLRISGDGFLVNSEILTQSRQLGATIIEVGVSHRPRKLGESTVSIRHIPQVLGALVRYWWNEVQFCADSGGNGRRRALPRSGYRSATLAGWLQIGLLLIAAVFMLTNLSYPLIDRDETRYAEIPREMIVTGNWVLPQLNFQAYYDKPPLVYWLCALSFKVFGISEASARLVPALSALATLACTMFFGSRIFGRRIGLLAGVVLALSTGFVFTSRYLLLDGVLALWVSLSLFTAYEAISRPASWRGAALGHERCSTGFLGGLRLEWWIASGVFVGLGFLTKGPIAIVLWFPPVFSFAWLSSGYVKLRWRHYAIVGGVAAAVATPWLVLVHQQDPTFLIEFFYKHNLARFAGEFHPKPVWFFVPVLLVAGHPWSFLTIPYAQFLFGRSQALRSHRPVGVGFLLLWSSWCFTFFSMSKCKLPTYLLPTAPALALMIGHFCEQWMWQPDNAKEHQLARYGAPRAATGATCLAGVGFAVFLLITVSSVVMSATLWAALWVGVLACLVTIRGKHHDTRFAWMATAVTTLLLAIMVMHQVLPVYSRTHTLFGESSPLMRQLAVTERTPIATVDHEFSDVPFYLKRQDIPNFADVRDGRVAAFVTTYGTAFLIVDNRVSNELVRSQLPPHVQLIDLAQRGPARIYQATSLPVTTGVAVAAGDVSQGSRR